MHNVCVYVYVDTITSQTVEQIWLKIARYDHQVSRIVLC